MACPDGVTQWLSPCGFIVGCCWRVWVGRRGRGKLENVVRRGNMTTQKRMVRKICPFRSWLPRTVSYRNCQIRDSQWEDVGVCGRGDMGVVGKKMYLRCGIMTAWNRVEIFFFCLFCLWLAWVVLCRGHICRDLQWKCVGGCGQSSMGMEDLRRV